MPSRQSGDNFPSVFSLMHSFLMSHFGQISFLISFVLRFSMFLCFKTSYTSFRYFPSAILGDFVFGSFQPFLYSPKFVQSFGTLRRIASLTYPNNILFVIRPIKAAWEQIVDCKILFCAAEYAFILLLPFLNILPNLIPENLSFLKLPKFSHHKPIICFLKTS